MSRWILQRASNDDAGVRLFCFPHAGGGASSYVGWTLGLPSTIDLFPIQLPGHENRFGEPLLTSIQSMARAALTELEPLFDRPFAFFGHSMGSLVAFELARLLRARGAPLPFLLIASGHVAPDVPLQRRPIHDLPDPDFMAELASLQGTPPEILADPDMFEFFLAPLRADFTACDRYVCAPEPPLDVPIVALGGMSDRTEPLSHMLSWSRQTTGSFALRSFAGGHFFVHTSRAEVIAEVVKAIESARPNVVMPELPK